MKLYDCFMFYDESLLLEIRLNILNKFIDKFVISEAKYLHNGKQKKLNFNINDFSEFRNKIEYIVVDNDPEGIKYSNPKDSTEKSDNIKILNSLMRENYQREMLARGLRSLDDEDIIIISDVDEIPNLTNFNFRDLKNDIAIFEQQMFYYKFNLYYKNFNWFGSKAVKKKNFISPQWLRNIKSKKYANWRLDTFFSKKKYRNIKFIENGGWHFTCIKKPKKVHEKLLSYLHHQDYESSKLTIKDIENKINKREILYDHSMDKKIRNKWLTNKKLEIINDSNLPDYLKNNREIYNDWFIG